jgi:hypothetical protein
VLSQSIVTRPTVREWSGEPIKCGDLFTLRSTTVLGEHVAVCQLWTHRLGLELRLLIDDALSRFQICRTDEACWESAGAWRVEMIGKGWSEAPSTGGPTPREGETRKGEPASRRWRHTSTRPADSRRH